MWGYQENLDQLKQSVTMMSLELEEMKKQANVERMKNKMTIDQLQTRLKIVSLERDEAISQGQKLVQLFLAQTQPGSLDVISGKTNLNITNTDSLDNIAPDFSTMNVQTSSCVGFANQVLLPRQLAYLESISQERATACFDGFSMDINPPPKGKLSLIMNELRNRSFCGLSITSPHPPETSSCTPHAPISGLENGYTNQNPVTNPQMCSTSMLNFPTLGSGSCMSSGRLWTPGMSNQIPVAKHPRST